MLYLLLGQSIANAASTSAGDEFLSTIEGVPPTIVFLVDLSAEMGDNCGAYGDSGIADAAITKTCLEYTIDAIDQVTQHYDWAKFGVVGTSDSESETDFYEIAPVGSSNSEISNALSSVSAHSTDTRNLAETLQSVSDYVSGRGTNSVIDYDCEQIHVVTITAGIPSYDDDIESDLKLTSGMPRDVTCDSSHTYGATDEWCLYDNIVFNLYNNFDARPDLSSRQSILTHTVGIRVDGSSLSEDLFGSASEATDGDGMYLVANEGDEILSKIMYALNDIRAGYYSRSAPVVTAEGDYLIYSFYEIAGLTGVSDERGSPLAQGHVRAYGINEDGDVTTDGPSQFGGAIWDAGDLLVSRPVLSSETNPDLPDGFGQRNIFTFSEELALHVSPSDSVWSERYPAGTNSTKRMDLDADFVDAVDTFGLLDTYLDTSTLAHDFDQDEDVDTDDLQYLIDFTRGLPTATFRYLDQERGYWKLGDSPHATPAVVTARNNTYSSDPTYRRFLKGLEDAHDDYPELYPNIVLIPANDGILHAFSLEDYLDRPASSLSTDEDDEQAGEELWGWALSYALYNDTSEDWSGKFTDLMMYGRTFLFDGSPVVEDVWIDADNDGVKECSLESFPTNCEWHRVVVVQQGKGGPTTLALDISVPAQPEYLWEHLGPEVYNDVDYTAMGYSVSRPVVANLYDKNEPHDRWTVIWGSGRAVPYASSADYYKSSEPNLYFHHISDDYLNSYYDAVDFDRAGINIHPEPGSSVNLDTDGSYEYGYISGAVSVVDVDSDGDSDVIYFPVTVSYDPSSGVSDIADPGHTWFYKAVIDTSDLDNPEWCEFVDPYDYVEARQEVYYASTTAWHTDGSLGVYWGTGSPYDRLNSDPGYVFGFIDESPTSCPTTATPICTGGYLEMDEGEGLTGNPIAYQGVVYFPTYTPNEDRCENGLGKIRGMSYNTCEGGIDTNGDGQANAEYVETDGYPSSITITDQGEVIWGSSNFDDNNGISTMSVVADPFKGTKTMMIREVF